MKKLFLFLVASIFCGNVFCQSKITYDYALSYRQAKIHFEQKEYGKSLKCAEEAIRQKKESAQKLSKKLENSLATRQVKAAGDKIDDVLKVLKLRDEKDCIKIINDNIALKGKSFFNNSVKQIVSYIKAQEQYPEVYKLIGDIYKIEGEYSLSEEYYQKAWENKDILDVKDEKYEILYLLAELSQITGDYNKMEVRLLNITQAETVEKRNILLKSMTTLIKKDSKDTLNKFFQMYRFSDFYSLKAYCLLADYYMSINLEEKALSFSALAVITGFTKLENVISKRDIDYKYVDLQTFLEDVSNYYDLVSWGDENNIWQSFDLLCELSEKIGAKSFSYDLLQILAKSSPNEYYQKAAVLKLDSIN